MDRPSRLKLPRVPRLEDGPRGEVLRRATEPVLPRLSVIIPSYNTAPFVAEAIGSALGQTLRDLEVVVVDDGSTDDSLERILAIGDPRLTCVRQPNLGLAGARNTGILNARAPLIGFLDSDDLWHPDKASKLVERLERMPELAGAFSWSEYILEDGTHTGRLLTAPRGALGAREIVRRNHLGNGSSAIVRRSALAAAGLYDESLQNLEEWELWVRIAALDGRKFRAVAEPLTWYRIRGSSLSHTHDHFVMNGWLAIRRFRRVVPELPERSLRHAMAELFRITSRKSLAAGRREESRRYLGEAVRRRPTVLVADPRATVLLAVHLVERALPERLRGRLFPWVEGVSRVAFRLRRMQVRLGS